MIFGTWIEDHTAWEKSFHIREKFVYFKKKNYDHGSYYIEIKKNIFEYLDVYWAVCMVVCRVTIIMIKKYNFIFFATKW